MTDKVDAALPGAGLVKHAEAMRKLAESLLAERQARVEAERERDRLRAALAGCVCGDCGEGMASPIDPDGYDCERCRLIRAALGAEPGDAAATPDALRERVSALVPADGVSPRWILECSPNHIDSMAGDPSRWPLCMGCVCKAISAALAPPLAPTPKGEP